MLFAMDKNVLLDLLSHKDNANKHSKKFENDKKCNIGMTHSKIQGIRLGPSCTVDIQIICYSIRYHRTVLLYSNFIMYIIKRQQQYKALATVYKALATDSILVKTCTLWHYDICILYVIMPSCPCLNH